MKRIFTLIAISIGLLFLVGCTNHPTQTTDVPYTNTGVNVPAPSPVTLDGKWEQTSGMNGVVMTATIADGKIQIDMAMSNVSGLYWAGTFDANSASITIVSKADTNALADDMLASEATSKTFTYKDGDLSYQFSILGMTSTVHLSRS